jgi:hypothetical protein
VGPLVAEEEDAALAQVGLARSDHLYLPGPVYAPPGVYPEGKIDWEVVSTLVPESARAAGLAVPWDLFAPRDRVAVMIDATPPAVPIILVEAVLTQLVEAGLPTSQLFIFSADERDLYAAGFSLRDSGPGVRSYGSDSVGFRGGISRLVLDQCDHIVSVSRLRPHPQLGMTGAVANYLNAVEPPWRHRVRENPEEEIVSVAKNVRLRQRMALHLVDCTHLPYALADETEEEDPRWLYRGLLCSTDPVAVDVVATQLLEAKRQEVRGCPWPLDPAPSYLEAAADNGMGTFCREEIELTRWGDEEDVLL